jgi:peptide/nickel transport system permease protein
MQLSGMTMRMMRTMMLEVLRQDYIRTAWAKGLTERVVVMRHALKNAFIPVITIIGWQVPLLVGGAVIIENIFQLPGMGQLMVSAVQQRDYPTIGAIMIILTSAVLILNLLIDMVYSFLDPRIHYK